MPFILPQTDNSTSMEKFNSIVEKYKNVIDNNPTARCMIGFAAATMIRDDGDMDLDSVESWLKTIEEPQEQVTVPINECDSDEGVDKIMSVLANTAKKYCDDEGEEDQAEPTDDTSHEFVVDNQLHRYVSRNPYTSAESYPTHVYIPDRIHVNHSFGNLFLPLESSC
ncbi:hypothetical protein [Parasitella parasitica]|uniref:Uncharacterized protein n=1 Tax=Parasitella parasitica TaxID=35722 RepID=A0A0B7N8Z0_9FUNG|nr:hypothetical protein [Parasitella parasitica]